jgi:hypothetical protein
MADTTHAVARPQSDEINRSADQPVRRVIATAVGAGVDQADRAMQLLSGNANQRGRQWQLQ